MGLEPTTLYTLDRALYHMFKKLYKVFQKTGRKRKRFKVCRFHRLGGEGESGERGEGRRGEMGEGGEKPRRDIYPQISLYSCIQGHTSTYILVGIGCTVGIQYMRANLPINNTKRQFSM